MGAAMQGTPGSLLVVVQFSIQYLNAVSHVHTHV